MKICFIGLGSIGKRHLRNLRTILGEKGDEYEIDAVRGTDSALEPDIQAALGRQYRSMDEMPDDYDVVFVTNPTSMHYDTVRTAAGKTRHMFIEKPVFDRNDYGCTGLGLRMDGVYYVACPMRYTAVIRYLKEYAEVNPVYGARCICSSYLPDWRPGTDYRQSYSAQSDMGGGVRIDLIHEWDYISHIFGMPEAVNSFSGTFSGLEISSEDLAVYIAKYPGMALTLHLDYMGRKTRRELELFCAEDTVVGDVTNGQIRFLKEGRTVELQEDRDAYQRRELEAFLQMVRGERENCNGIARALDVLKLTETVQ